MVVMAEKKLVMVVLMPLLCLIVPLTRGITVNFTYCGAKADENPIIVQTLNITPYPVVFGEEVSLTVVGDIAKPISGGVLKLEVGISGTKIIIFRYYDLCGEGESIFGSSPVGAGLFLMSRSHPYGFLPLTSHIKAIVTDEEGRELLCIEFDFEVAAGSSRRYIARAA